jgi:TRAP transporter TAXI family solute receptor
MEARSWLRLLTGASLISALVAMMGGRAPRWLRIMLVLTIVVVALGVGLYTYKYLARPTTVSVAVGSVDGDVSKVLQSLATKMAASNSPVRLKIIDKGTARAAAKAFSDGESDLAIVRSDLPGLSNARTLLLVTHGVVLIVVPPGSPITSIGDLKGKTVGVLGGEINQRLAGVLTKEFDLGRVNMQFRDVPIGDAQQALAAKQVQALLLVVPVSEKYLALLRSMFPGTAKQKMGLIPIESAQAIATIAREYESYELPKGTIKGAPPIPEDDLTTLRVPFYLVAKKTMSDDLAGAITKTVMDSRRDLTGEFPLLATIGEPNTDKDAFIPVHPGAAAYFDGDQKTIFDKYGDQLFYGSMLLGGLMSILAATWNFMTAANPAPPEQRPLNRLYALTERIRRAGSEAELAEIEQCIDDIIQAELDKYAEGRASANEAAALSLATHRVEYLIDRCRASLGRPARRHQAS